MKSKLKHRSKKARVLFMYATHCHDLFCISMKYHEYIFQSFLKPVLCAPHHHNQLFVAVKYHEKGIQVVKRIKKNFQTNGNHTHCRTFQVKQKVMDGFIQATHIPLRKSRKEKRAHLLTYSARHSRADIKKLCFSTKIKPVLSAPVTLKIMPR